MSDEKKHSCLDREYWYHLACDDLEWKNTIAEYECPGFDFSPFPKSLETLKTLSFPDLVKRAADFGLEPSGEDRREYLELATFYKPVMNALNDYHQKISAYTKRFAKCAAARQNYYQECEENDEGHVEDAGHRHARMTFNRYVAACRALRDNVNERLIILRRDYHRLKVQLKEKQQQFVSPSAEVTTVEEEEEPPVDVETVEEEHTPDDVATAVEEKSTPSGKFAKKAKRKKELRARRKTREIFQRRAQELDNYRLPPPIHPLSTLGEGSEIDDPQTELPYLKQLCTHSSK